MITDQQQMVGGKKGFLTWLNHLYNSFFGSIFGYTDTVKLGGGARTKTRRNRKSKNVTYRKK